MANLPKKRTYVSYVLSICFSLILLFTLSVLVRDKLSTFELVDGHNQLAQILAVETDLLKRWQQSGSLKRNLAYGSEGSDVVLLQRLLSQDSTIYPEKKVTGYYGTLTSGAVREFQREYGLRETGTVDVVTRNKLNEVFLSHLCPEPAVSYPELIAKKITRDSPLPTDYVSPLLEEISDQVKTGSVTCLRSDVTPNLKRMFTDALGDGVELMVTSGYRKPEIQQYLYDFWFRIEGESALDEIAKPGHSEHQLGSTVDLTDSSIGFAGVDPRFAYSEGGLWLKENAHKYGFVMSYPPDKEEQTGYEHEPWHWRFVGIDKASELHESRLTYNEASFDSDNWISLKKDIESLDLSADDFMAIAVSDNGDKKVLVKKHQGWESPVTTYIRFALAAPDVVSESETLPDSYHFWDIDRDFETNTTDIEELFDLRDEPFEAIGGVLGETDSDKQNALLVSESPCDGKIYSVVLGSKAGVDDLQEMLKYIDGSYTWTCS